MNHPSRLVLAGVLLVGIASCGGPSSVAGEGIKPVSNAEAFEGVQCSAVRPQTEPDLMAWDSGSRLNLKRLRNEGVVAVRYEAQGCNVKLELLSGCVADGKYAYTPYSANETKVAHNASELYAQLPLGAASLTGKVKGGRSLRTDYALAGQYSLSAKARFSRADLQGPGCERATHVVSSMYVGGFALVSGESRELDAAVSVFSMGAGAATAASSERLAREGSAEACEKAQESSTPNIGCDVPLRIGLLALDEKPVASKLAATDEEPVAVPVQKAAPVAKAAPNFSPTAAPVPIAAPPPTPAPSSINDMVKIAAGAYEMGSNDGRVNEKPSHRVQVAAFSIDVTEVTARAYENCEKAGVCTAAQRADLCTAGVANKSNHPINCVNWEQADAYCKWVGKRLPTEEEWEFAARGTDGRKFPWGGSILGARACWNRMANKEGTCEVGGFSQGASAFGALDMAGNVSEWTSSAYSEDYVSNRSDAKRVTRGGGWFNADSSILSATSRNGDKPSLRSYNVGFRCAK